ncbi:hypothetical protein [Anatilimnocola floriformis]|uniref:hypothetical protein n=1 Tax=Anatilimnocola floriformis TaxID=2948575 RepID=UPI0020C4DD9F|nr:hypothetical protein [Anatilimnocola floriformis]
MSLTSSNQPTTNTDIAEILLRVTALESEVAKLKREKPKGSRWLDNVKGSMKDDPEFAEVLRLGREFRQSYHTE